MTSATTQMRIIFVDNNSGDVIVLKRFTYFPYAGEMFCDENDNAWRVTNISTDLRNGKMHIYITKVTV